VKVGDYSFVFIRCSSQFPDTSVVADADDSKSLNLFSMLPSERFQSEDVKPTLKSKVIFSFD